MTTPKFRSTRIPNAPDLARRLSGEPLLTPDDITPSDTRLTVIGVFNAAVYATSDQVRLIVRIDERPQDPLVAQRSDGRKYIAVPRVSLAAAEPRLDIVNVNVPDSYLPVNQGVLPPNSHGHGGEVGPLLLSHISHLRLADQSGTGWKVREEVLVGPSDQWSQFGCEDPRVSWLAGKPYLTYAAISRYGATSWAVELDADGMAGSPQLLLGPDHKHAFFLPERVKDQYWLFARPLVRSWVHDDGIWTYHGGALDCWHDPAPLLMPRPGCWDSVRVGPGAPPLRLPEGWLLLYYGVDESDSYHIGAALLKYSNPAVVISRTAVPVLSPSLSWEQHGRRADTVFCCGALLHSDLGAARLFYGAADQCIGVADVSMASLRAALKPA